MSKKLNRKDAEKVIAQLNREQRAGERKAAQANGSAQTQTYIPGTEPEAKPSDFLIFVGGSYYTKESFIAEAAQMGISRRMPSHRLPDDLVSGKSRVYVACGGQRVTDHEDSRANAEVFGYFIPQRVEFIAGKRGEGFYADVVATLKLRPDSMVIGEISHEPARGCGQRKEGGTYLVVDKADSPLILLNPPVPYNGNHFRGMMRLSPVDAAVLSGECSGTVGRLVEEECMNCGAKTLVSPSGRKEAERERRRIDRDGAPKWRLLCGKCRKEARRAKMEAKKAAKATEATDSQGVAQS